MKSVSKQLKEWEACADGYKWATENCKTMAEVWDKCERGDWLLWLLQKNGWGNKKEKIRVAVAFAEHVLHIYESRYPNDDRPRKAIETARACIENDTPENRAAADAVADAAADAVADAAADAVADAAARAAYAAADAVADAAADAAANAVADAAYAANAAVYAANAAYAAYAANAAVYAADAAATSAAAYAAERKWQANAIRKVVANPFKKEST